MFAKMFVQEALIQTLGFDKNPGRIPDIYADNYTCVTSLLIYDIFGGEILKTRKKDGWYFYNRIEGERIDFTGSEINKTYEDSQFEDLPSTADETMAYFDQEEYSNLYSKFISVYEEAVGL